MRRLLAIEPTGWQMLLFPQRSAMVDSARAETYPLAERPCSRRTPYVWGWQCPGKCVRATRYGVVT